MQRRGGVLGGQERATGAAMVRREAVAMVVVKTAVAAGRLESGGQSMD
jgi:hypothetical protein